MMNLDFLKSPSPRPEFNLIRLPDAHPSGEGCQGCGGTYDPSDVMVVDDVGPVCLECTYRILQRAFSSE